MKATEIAERREKISYYIVKGMPEKTIAELLGVSRNTIVRDVAYLKNTSRNWLDDLAKDGFIYEYRLSLQKIRDHESELQKLFLESESVTQKIKILEALDANAKLFLDLLGETPAVHAYKRAISFIGKDNGGSSDKNMDGNNKGGSTKWQ